MTGLVLAGVSLGAAIGLGLWMVVAGLQGRRVFPERRRDARQLTITTETQQRLVAAVVVGLLVILVTRWPVAGISIAAVIVLWPKVFGSTAAGRHEVERVEALAVWTESLRDTVAGAMSLENAIPSTVEAAPPLLTQPLQHLVATMNARTPLPQALARFGDDLNDSSADLVIAALILNANLRGPGLVSALTELAGHARAELELRQRIEASRQPLRRAAWIIVGFTLAFTGGLALFARDYVAAYSDLTGQMILAIVLGLFAWSFAWARKLSNYAAPPRFLIGADELANSQLLAGRS